MDSKNKIIIVLLFLAVGLQAQSPFYGVRKFISTDLADTTTMNGSYMFGLDSANIGGVKLSYKNEGDFSYYNYLQFDKPIWPIGGLGVHNSDFSILLDARSYSVSAMHINLKTISAKWGLDVWGTLNDPLQIGVNSIIRYGTGIVGSSSYGIGVKGVTAFSGVAGNFIYSHGANSSNPIVKIEMGNGNATYNWTSDFLQMRSTQTHTTGSWNGSFIGIRDSVSNTNNTSKFLTGYVWNNKVLEFNPRVTSGAGNSAYMFDTYNLLSAGYRARFYNQGVDPINFDYDGSIDLPSGAEFKIAGTPIGGGENIFVSAPLYMDEDTTKLTNMSNYSSYLADSSSGIALVLNDNLKTGLFMYNTGGNPHVLLGSGVGYPSSEMTNMGYSLAINDSSTYYQGDDYFEIKQLSGTEVPNAMLLRSGNLYVGNGYGDEDPDNIVVTRGYADANYSGGGADPHITDSTFEIYHDSVWFYVNKEEIYYENNRNVYFNIFNLNDGNPGFQITTGLGKTVSSDTSGMTIWSGLTLGMSYKTTNGTIRYNSSTDNFEGKKSTGWEVLGGGGEVDTSGTPVANQVPYFTAANKIGGSDLFTYSDTTLSLINHSVDTSFSVINNSTGYGVYIYNSSTGIGSRINNTSTGTGSYISNSSTGTGSYITNTSTGKAFEINGTTGIVMTAYNDSVAINKNTYIETLTLKSTQDTTVTAEVGKIVFKASDAHFYGCRKLTGQKWFQLDQ